MNTKLRLNQFLQGIPELKRKLNPDLSHPTDFKRLVLVAISLIDENETISTQDISTTCESINGIYPELLKLEEFESQFCEPIVSAINNVKYIIEVYKSIN